jgi:hypothetical protein
MGPGIGTGGGMPPLAGAMGGMPPAAPPPMTPPGFPGPGGGIDPELIARVIARLSPPKPMYPAWFKIPQKPDAAGVAEVGKRRWEDLRLWRTAVYSDIVLLRLDDSGIFEDDKTLYEAGIIDDFVSPALIAEYNLAVTILAGMEPRFKKAVHEDRLSLMARQYAVAVSWLRQLEEEKWAEGNGDLRTDETKHLLTYGMLVKRRTIDLADPDYPYDPFLIDPCSAVTEWEGKRGLRRFWRVYRSTIGNLVAAYGDLTASQKKALGNEIGSASSWDDDTEVPYVVEYWDRWWRCVVLPGGRPLVPVTAHEYGETPVTVSYGPLGEPMGVQTPYEIALKDKSGDITGVDTDKKIDRVYQSVGFVRFIKEGTKTNEAVIRRMLYGIKKSLDPAIIRYRSNAAAKDAPPEMDGTPGATNEAIFGEEKLEPYLATAMPFEVQAVMQQIMQDSSAIKFPPMAHGVYEGSNISGVASGNSIDLGYDRVSLWARTLETFHARDMALAMRMWRNFGHLAKYAGEEPRPLMVPVPRPQQRSGEAPAFELTRDLIDAVGPRVAVRLTRVRKQDMVPLFQAAKIATELGVPFWAYLAEEWFNLPDVDHLEEEGQEEQAIRQALQLPEFVKAVTIPNAFAEAYEEAAGDPERQEIIATMKQSWDLVALGGGQGQPPAIGPGGAVPPEGGNPPGVNPPTSAGVSYPNSGQGPGSVTGNQGGPQGPYGGQGTDVGP